MIKIKKLYEDVEIPEFATEGSAGFDLVAHNFQVLYPADDPSNLASPLSHYTLKNLLLTPRSRVLIGCGFSLEIPTLSHVQILSRSGLSLKKGVIVLNAPGIIDSDYRGEIGVILYNASAFAVTIELGEKIAQGILIAHSNEDSCPAFSRFFNVVEWLSTTKRDKGGFGHTDK